MINSNYLDMLYFLHEYLSNDPLMVIEADNISSAWDKAHSVVKNTVNFLTLDELVI